jgi:hypothetical protein
MSSPITDKAEVSIDFPDKFYMGSFGRGSRYDVTADKDGVHIHLERVEGETRRVGIHIHYHLLAEILAAASDAIGKVEGIEPRYLEQLRDAGAGLAKRD